MRSTMLPSSSNAQCFLSMIESGVSMSTSLSGSSSSSSLIRSSKSSFNSSTSPSIFQRNIFWIIGLEDKMVIRTSSVPTQPVKAMLDL
eukprot:03839.XXX_5988_6251_1 [CDS] Oithona nana genome sequencing.